MTSNLASGVPPLALGTGSEGTISRVSAEGLEMCKPRRQMAGEGCHTLVVLVQLDLRISVPLNVAGII